MRDPIPQPFNMAAYVLAKAEENPDKIALAVLGPARAERWSYGRLAAAVRGAATGLLRHGLSAGDRVLLRLGNTPDFPIAFLACLSVDIVPVPTSSQLSQREITKLAADLDPSAIIAAPGIACPDHPATIIPDTDVRSFYSLPTAPFAMGDPNRPGYIIYTSGTSGSARGVVHAHRAILARRMMHNGWYGLSHDDRLLHAGAFNWTYTLGTGLMDPWSMGATALIPAAGTDPALLPLLLKRHDVTIFAAAPGVYRQMLRQAIPPLPKLRHGLSAGEKLPDTTRDAWSVATGLPIHEAFGMSECSTFLSGSPDRPAPPGTLGFPQTGRNIALLDGDGAAADLGQIAVHRDDPGLMLGYLNAPNETAARFSGPWFLTGDIGERGPDGAITYKGRVDDMINAGGFRVSPLEVEAALEQIDQISEAAAVELQIKPDTSIIAAFYCADHPIDDGALTAHCASVLARYKQPRLFVHCPALPRGANNKLLRRKLRQDWEHQNGQT